VVLAIRRPLVPAATLALAAAMAPVLAASPAAAVSPDIVVSQVYGAGGNAGAPLTNDYIEIYNRGDSSVDLTGWSVQYASATGTGTFAANSPTALTGTLPAGKHYLVQLGSGGANGVALPTPDATGSTNMSGTAGKVVAVRPGATLGLACNGSSDPCDGSETARIADLVGYGTANYFETAAAPAASTTTAIFRAADGATDTDNNSTDFAAAAPNPRACGDDCVPPPPSCDPPPSFEIAQIQGSGSSTPHAGECVRTEGVVTGDFNGTGGLGGFYIQDPTPDADPATSEGIFVASTADVSPGDLVSVDGTASEGFGQTQLSSATVTVTGTGSISATTYDLPRPVDTTFEPVEGMLVTFPEVLTATEHFQLGRFGEVTVSSDGRIYQPTDIGPPGAPAQALLALAARRKLLIDNGSNVQNPTSVPYLTPQAVRIGDTTSGITGVLGFGFSNYRLQPTSPIGFTRTNPRPATPADVGGDIKVASFNTLNYFTTLTSENPDARGANSAVEFDRQQIKEVEAITGLDADVMGLMEVENNGTEAIGSLVSALNEATAPGTYAFISEPSLNPPNEFGGEFGTDAIKVALIYRPAAVAPVGSALTSTDSVFDRPPLIQTFERVGGSEQFTAVVNHFKSKSCATGSDPLDTDQGDGQGCFNQRRGLQAAALVSTLDTLAPPNPLIIGDLNSYTEEDPIHDLEDAGYTGLSEEFIDDAARYSFVFDGFSGELDHALAGTDLVDNVTGAAIWHINADEPLILDYNLDFGRDPDLFEANAYRTSDHDPLIVGLELNDPPTVDAGGPYDVVEGSSVTLSASGSDPDGDELSYAWDLDANGSFETLGQNVSFSAAGLQAPASPTVSVRVTDPEGLIGTDTATVRVIWDFDGFTGTVKNPPAVNVVQAGSTVSVQFSLDGDQGLAILAAGSPASADADCVTHDPTGPLQPTSAKAKAALSYDAALDTYTYVWKTNKAWTSTCRQLVVTLADGTSYSADFGFKP